MIGGITMTAACLAIGGLIFITVLIGTGVVNRSSREMTEEELENYQQQLQQIYGPIYDAIDPQRVEEKRREKLMNDHEYYLLTGELPPTK